MVRSQQRTEIERSTQGIPGLIASNTLYRADELKARMGWRNAAFRAACRRGLRTHRVGKRVFIAGADVLAFVQQKGGAE
jgi:hypothetical protein